MNNVRNDKFKCLLCLFSDSTIVTSCGCLFCDNCYQETKSYINKEKVDWTYMCNNNRIISAKDELELVYEENETDVNNKNLVTSE